MKSRSFKIVVAALFLTSIIIFYSQNCWAVSNPAAMYCEAMGYSYSTSQVADNATVSLCHFPDGSSANAWQFYHGQEAQSFSYCEQNGYRMEADSINKGSYTIKVPVCVSQTKRREFQRFPMIDLMKQKGVLPIEEPTPFSRPSASKQELPGLDPKLIERSYPASLDWRNYNGHTYIGSVRDQGDCRSCYAFGATASAEAVYNIHNNLYDSQCVDFSESFVAWCLGKYGPYSSHFSGCDGANYEYAELTALTSEGITWEANFPYTDSDPGSCTHWNDPVVTFQNWGRIDPNDTDAIQAAITNYGVLDVAVLVTDNFRNYTGGIFVDTQTTCPEGAYTPTNHAVALVGWGTDPVHGLYWILRNSWNTWWGENGYMRIQAKSARVACAATFLTYQSSSSSILKFLPAILQPESN